MSSRRPLVSIIIPMYNAASTIATCIESIQKQTYSLIEIIVINDGSTDTSMDIVKEIQQHDKRIELFTQENQGVSAARNEGIRHARGVFIQFVDADDWIEPTMTAQLTEQMEKGVDLGICGYQTAKTKIKPAKTCIKNRKNWLQAIGNLYAQNLLQSPCNKIYRRQLIQTKNIQFQYDLSIGEDFLFNLAYLTYTNKLALLATTPYNYERTKDSLTRTYDPNLFTIQKQLHHAWQSFLQDNHYDTKINVRAGANIFIQGTAFSIDNIYRTPSLKTNTKYKQVKKIVHDKLVEETAKLTHNYLSILLRYKQTRLIQLLYIMKNIMRK